MPNLLRFETSAYLLQHKDNPVHWRPWGAAALAEAAATDRPILLSVGYAACHWCHVMAHESFEDPETAAVMNALFVNIKVDRQERPDIDQLYMSALHAFGEQGGWPLTMFLTPDGKPIWGGTYFPPEARYGRPGFRDILRKVAGIYRDDPSALVDQGERVVAHLARSRPAGATLGPELIDRAAETLASLMDPQRGGTRGAPKFPNASVQDFLARSAERMTRPDLRALVDATHRGLVDGGIYDHVGGGLARYSTDADWLVPHFEKMLYDNAQLVEQLALDLTQAADPALYRDRISGTIAFMERELLRPEGGFASGLDADAAGVEGSFTVWDHAELLTLLGVEDGAFMAALYDIAPGGNWEGKSIPNRLHHPDTLPAADEERRLRLLDEMRRHRETRPRPALDDQILTDWNALAIVGLATAGFLLERSDWIDRAESVYRFLGEAVSVEGRPVHVFAKGRRGRLGLATDLAGLARAALGLHQVTGKAAYQADAARFLALLWKHHGDGADGFCLAPDDGDRLILRRAERLDEATPNAHGMAAEAHLRLWALTGADEHRTAADAILAAAAGDMIANVFGTASLFSSLDLRLRITTLVIILPAGTSADGLLPAIRRSWSRSFVLDIRFEETELPPAHPAHDKKAVGGKPTAYVCHEGRCSLPVTDAAALAALLPAGA
ncbi:thioredoxin domain-containing protein [Kaistia geumhonensis]|uniref:Uncharacterized protein YyaL (SSP411 family) n=1 Tax=Kaistia geumhonensis TaxID=410839 RepID=A0ABU0M7T1_9HYPH|nr:thioredoxin domain-containing protein [Kaistia geumhonensis]MCX5477762.1 thioredoxin domain-containing protein [Kaistia geumhonensis]MDQ0517027.1 uncharacterized protein YyaL (SSP411 family) [Kaistia geumhonensis]